MSYLVEHAVKQETVQNYKGSIVLSEKENSLQYV